MAHCAACHETFGSVTSFDRHRKQGSCRPADLDGRLTYHPTRQAWIELRTVGDGLQSHEQARLVPQCGV